MYFDNNSIIYLDGSFVKASETSTSLYGQTLHYGNGVFEGIRSYDTADGVRIFKAKEHFDRLIYSANTMGIPFDLTSESLEQLSYSLLEQNNLKDAYLRPLVFMSPNMSLTSDNEAHLVIMAWEWGRYLGSEPLKVMLSSYQRPNPRSCHVEAKVVGHYTNSILATNEAKAKGYDEALLTDMHGYVAEGPGANFFFEKDEKLITAPLGNILNGITRQTVLEIANELQIPVEVRLFTPDEIYSADTAFFCGTAAEVAEIGQFNNHKFPMNWEDSVSAMVQKKYLRRVAHNEFQNMHV